MNKIPAFFREISPLKMVLLVLPFLIISLFIEKSLPSVFLFARMLAFIVVIFAVVKFFNSKF